MSSWIPAAIGAAGGIAAGLFGGSEENQIELDETTRKLQHILLKPETARVHPRRESPLTYNVWDLPEVGYGPVRVHQGASPAASASLLDMISRGTRGSPYEQAAQRYALGAITGQGLYSNPAMGPLGFYGIGGGQPNFFGGPGRQLMLGTAAGSGYSNPYLDAMVNQAQRRTGANVASMFGRGRMGGSSMETQLAAREMGDIASRMYGGAYEAERGRQTAMQQALGGLETSRLGQMMTGRGQSIGAAGDLGRVFGQERGLQQEAAFNVERLSGLDWTNLQTRLQAAQALEQYGLLRRQEQQQAWQANQLASRDRLGFIGGLAAGQPTGQRETTEISPNWAALALGGAATGMGLYNVWQRNQQSPYTASPPPLPAPTPGYPGGRGGWV